VTGTPAERGEWRRSGETLLDLSGVPGPVNPGAICRGASGTRGITTARTDAAARGRSKDELQARTAHEVAVSTSSPARPFRRAFVPALLAPGAAVIVLDRLDAAGALLLFVLAAASLAPIAWLIGEATRQAAQHTGPGIGGFLNASFGNAPELVIALVAVAHGLPEVVRASLAGSIVGNLLLVLGFVFIAAPPRRLDRTSAFASLATVAVAASVMLPAAALSFGGDPDQHSLAVLSLPIAVALLIVRVLVTRRLLRRHRRLRAVSEPTPTGGWSLRSAIGTLAVATVITALVSQALVASLEPFARGAGLSELFVAAVIVAIAGNATEHGSAVLLAARGEVALATEIAYASSAQVAGFLIPVVVLVSWSIEPLALSFRPVEIFSIAAAAIVSGLVLTAEKSSRFAGVVLVAAYVGVAASFFVAGAR
jgi:Ca2+:H+ antiporter